MTLVTYLNNIIAYCLSVQLNYHWKVCEHSKFPVFNVYLFLKCIFWSRQASIVLWSISSSSSLVATQLVEPEAAAPLGWNWYLNIIVIQSEVPGRVSKSFFDGSCIRSAQSRWSGAGSQTQECILTIFQINTMICCVYEIHNTADLFRNCYLEKYYTCKFSIAREMVLYKELDRKCVCMAFCWEYVLCMIYNNKLLFPKPIHVF